MTTWETARSSTFEFLHVLETSGTGRLRRFAKGSLLYWQSEPADFLFVIKEGMVKISFFSPEGRVLTYGIASNGRLVGDVAFLLGGECESTCEALERTDAYVLSKAEFTAVAQMCPPFSEAVMVWLAHSVRDLARQARDLGSADVQQRLKHRLQWLADEHGRVTEKGVRIDLDLTHEDISELVAADRTTVTARLKDLRREGYVWQEGRRLYIPSAEHRCILDGLGQAVADGNEKAAISWANEAVHQQMDLTKGLQALAGAMRRVGRSFSREELALPDVILAADATKVAMRIIRRAMERSGIRVAAPDTVILGTVEGDIHDMGKTMVEAMLAAAGFEVVDIGCDQPVSAFADAAEEHHARIVGISAIMTTTIPVQRNVVEYFRARRIRDKYKILVGGAACSEEHAQRIGADAYASDATDAVRVARMLTGKVRRKT